MYSRKEYETRLLAVKQISRHEWRILAIVSVILGLAQLGLLRLAESHLSHTRATALSAFAFLLYMGLLGALVWRMKRRLRCAHPICPNCGIVLKGLSERVAAATGKCDTCKGDVVQQ